MDYFGVQDLFAEGEPGVGCAGEGAYYLQVRGGQVEQVVVGGEVLAEVGDLGRVELGFGEFGEDDGFAAAVDAAAEERLDAVGGLELLRCVAGGDGFAVGR